MSELQLSGGTSELTRRPAVQESPKKEFAGVTPDSKVGGTATDAAKGEDEKASIKDAQAAEKDRKRLAEASSNLNEFMQTMQRNLKFSVDEASGESVIAVHDAKTDELIRQIPSKEALELTHNMDKVIGLLFKAEA
jgi:flagellar protein FlaG